MRLAVIGAGNMGSVYGANLARIGEEVVFVDVWREHVDRINAAGLRLEGLSGDFVVSAKASTSAQDVPPVDAVLVCVNAYSTSHAARTAGDILKPDGFCLTLQNGVGNVEILTEALGYDRVLAGLSFQSGDLIAPGEVRHTNNGATFIGELNRARTPRLERLYSLLQGAGMNPEIVDDVIAVIWQKFIHNCGINAICAITGLRPGHIQEVPALLEFQRQIIEEALALVRAKGIELPPGDPSADIPEYCSHKFHRPSMMQHLDRGQRTEIDALNGYVARESARLGLLAPANDALTRLIKGREHRPTTEAAE